MHKNTEDPIFEDFMDYFASRFGKSWVFGRIWAKINSFSKINLPTRREKILFFSLKFCQSIDLLRVIFGRVEN